MPRGPEHLSREIGALPDLRAPLAVWRALLGSDEFAWVQPMLQPVRGERADSWTCGAPGGSSRHCGRQVIEQGDDEYEAVCPEDRPDCLVERLGRTDVAVHALGLLRLASAVARALHAMAVPGRSGPYATVGAPVASAVVGVLPLGQPVTALIVTSDDAAEILSTARLALASSGGSHALVLTPHADGRHPGPIAALESLHLWVRPFGRALHLRNGELSQAIPDVALALRGPNVDPAVWLAEHYDLVLDPARYRGWLRGAAFSYVNRRSAGRLLLALARRHGELVLLRDLAHSVWGDPGPGETTPNVADQKRELAEILEGAAAGVAPILNLPTAGTSEGGYRLDVTSVAWWSDEPEDRVAVPTPTQSKNRRPTAGKAKRGSKS